jgi:hypothetical protein
MKTAFLTYFIIIAINFMAISISNAQVDLTSAVAIYLLDEGSGKKVTDFTGNGNDGEFVSEPEWVDGKFGKALSLDGQDDYVQINSPVNIPGTSFTIGLWVKPGKTQKQYANILSNHSEPQRGYTFEQDGSQTNKFYTGLGAEGAWRAGVPQADRAVTQLETDVWQHFASVREEEKVTHYLNGKKSAECPVGTKAPISESPAKLRLGEWGGSAGRQFNGILDEIFILSAALSVDDIKTIMNRGIEGAQAVSTAGKLTTSWGEVKAQ